MRNDKKGKDNTVEPRFSVRFWGMGKMYAISKYPLNQGFILNQSNIEKVLSPPIGICLAIVCLSQTVKHLFSSSNGLVLRLLLTSIPFP